MAKMTFQNFPQSLLDTLEPLLARLKTSSSTDEKLVILSSYPAVKQSLANSPILNKALKRCNPQEKLVILSLLAIDQGSRVFKDLRDSDLESSQWTHLIQTLIDLENHYDTLGGIIGYHVMVLKLIISKNSSSKSLPKNVHYHHPQGIDLKQDTFEVRQAIRWGIEEMAHIAEIYPVGGAGDRLNLHNETTNEALPAALLPFCGKTLLEGLIRDLEAREYLHYKIIGKQLVTPIAMMTSHEKNNHKYIHEICQEHQWFGRPPNSFHFFTQPLVPVVTIQGNWVMQDHLKLMLKPGGHGVIWKLARDNGVLDRLIQLGRRYALVRQINNPIAGTDYGLIAHTGWGFHYGKEFGFASCPRLLNTAEGMNVLVEAISSEGVNYCITNIEYTEFEEKGVHDTPEKPGSSYSQFPANTNILFVDLETVKSTIEICPIPGMLINMKGSIEELDDKGETITVPAGRLESTMQNLADYIVDHSPARLSQITPYDLRTYVTYNERDKTISTTKKFYSPGESYSETPEGCFYDILSNYHQLLSKYCKMQLPPLGTIEDYLQNGPPFHILLHPAIGPLYQIISQKITHGVLTRGSELQLEIAELDFKHVQLNGSLLVHADNPLGKRDAQDEVYYGTETGKCVLRNVTIENKGIDKSVTQHYWKNQIVRQESFKIILRGNAEFHAEDLTFQGQQEIEVPDGYRMVAERSRGKIKYHLEELSAPSWYWSYAFDADNHIKLTKHLE